MPVRRKQTGMRKAKKQKRKHTIRRRRKRGKNVKECMRDKTSEIMHEWKRGELHSGRRSRTARRKPIQRNKKGQKQAVAIALNVSRKTCDGRYTKYKRNRRRTRRKK